MKSSALENRSLAFLADLQTLFLGCRCCEAPWTGRPCLGWGSRLISTTEPSSQVRVSHCSRTAPSSTRGAADNFHDIRFLLQVSLGKMQTQLSNPSLVCCVDAAKAHERLTVSQGDCPRLGLTRRGQRPGEQS